jgi:ubiquinone/menaquinone biosynthesis C-methylase UbiE
MSTHTETANARPAEGAISTDQALIQLLTGAWATQSVAAAAKLGIPEILAEGARTAEEVAAKAQAHAGATYRLLRSLASLGVLERRADGRFVNTPIGDRLRAGVPGNLKDIFIAETDHVHWQSWERLVDAVKTGLPRPKAVFDIPAFEYYAKHPAEGEQFGLGMQSISRFCSEAVLEAYDFSGVRTIMDVGGGNGSLALAILEKYPEMKGKIVDLPYIEPQAKLGIRAAGAAHRCEFESADFFRAVPKGADLQTLKFILHDWTDEECVQILRCCREALAPGGKILIVEMLVPEQIRPDFVMLMDLNMLVMTGGRERTAEEFEKLLSDAGFEMTRVIPTNSPFALIEGRPK